MPWWLIALVVVGLSLAVLVWRIRQFALKAGAATEADVEAFFAAREWNRLYGVAGLAKNAQVRDEAKQRLRQLVREDATIRKAFLRNLNPRGLSASQFEQGPLRSSLEKELFKELHALDFTLEEIRAQVVQLSTLFPREGATVVVLGATSGHTILQTVCGVCDDAVRALRTGLDANGQSITVREIGSGLSRVAADARHDNGVVATVLNPTGVSTFEGCLRGIDAVAARLA